MATLSNPASLLAPWTAALASALVLGTVLPPAVTAQSPPIKRAITPEQAPTAKAIENGKYYALVIGINTYPAPLPRLNTAENDAQTIAKILHDDYSFEVKLLSGSDATRINVLKAIIGYRALHDNDNLLIYYAGHGYMDKDAEKAFWLPADADSGLSPNRISADDITDNVRAMHARHVLVISDSCYSGDLARNRDTDLMAPTNGDDSVLVRMLNSRSRTMMSSGGDEPVSDKGRDNHSVFAYALLNALEANDLPMAAAGDLFAGPKGIQNTVGNHAHQVPYYKPIPYSSHDDGDFVFMRIGRASANMAKSSSPPSPATTTYHPAPAPNQPAATTPAATPPSALFVVPSNKVTVYLNAVIAAVRADLTAAAPTKADVSKDIADMREAVTTKPDEPILWVLYGDALDAQGDHLAAADKAAGRPLTSDDLAISTYTDSVAAYRKVAEVDPGLRRLSSADQANAFNSVGNVSAKLGKFSECFAAYEQAASLDPSRAGMFYTNGAVVLFNEQRLNEALAAAEKAIAAEPNSAAPYYIKGEILFQRATPDPKTKKIIPPPGCVEAYRRYLELAPHSMSAREVKKTLSRMGVKF